MTQSRPAKTIEFVSFRGGKSGRPPTGRTSGTGPRIQQAAAAIVMSGVVAWPRALCMRLTLTFSGSTAWTHLA